MCIRDRYEALQETADDEADRRSERSKRRIQVAFCVVIPAVLFLLGVPLFIEGRARGALSYMAIGFLLSVFAALMATGGFAMLFRPNKEEGARKARFDDAHWVMIQDKKKLEACQAEEEMCIRDRRLGEFPRRRRYPGLRRGIFGRRRNDGVFSRI